MCKLSSVNWAKNNTCLTGCEKCACIEYLQRRLSQLSKEAAVWGAVGERWSDSWGLLSSLFSCSVVYDSL